MHHSDGEMQLVGHQPLVADGDPACAFDEVPQSIDGGCGGHRQYNLSQSCF
jgi:hypothetical protein